MLLERRYGMPRGALRYVDLHDLGYDAPDRVHEHIASPWGVLARILPKREVSKEDVLIDIGCGMGPVLVEAGARYDFRRIIGIDVVPEFTKVAEETIERGREHLRCKDIDVLTGDVTEYELPDDVTVIFMADPFRGPIFDAALANILASIDRHPRVIRLIYSNPTEGGRIELSGRARLVRLGRRRGRPWTTSPELAMYEIAPAADGRAEAERPARPLPRRLRRRAPKGTPEGHRLAEGAALQARTGGPGTRVVLTGGLEDLRAAFERDHCVRLREFLSAPLLERISGYVQAGEDVKAEALMFMLLNDAGVFGHVRAITGCRRIGRFEGDLVRTPPGPKHAEPWHGYIFGHGMVSMTVDVGSGQHTGGLLELRDRHSLELVCRAQTGPGDALLARVAPFLQERVTAVEGELPRTVYGGRFMLSRSGADSALAAVGSGARDIQRLGVLAQPGGVQQHRAVLMRGGASTLLPERLGTHERVIDARSPPALGEVARSAAPQRLAVARLRRARENGVGQHGAEQGAHRGGAVTESDPASGIGERGQEARVDERMDQMRAGVRGKDGEAPLCRAHGAPAREPVDPARPEARLLGARQRGEPRRSSSRLGAQPVEAHQPVAVQLAPRARRPWRRRVRQSEGVAGHQRPAPGERVGVAAPAPARE